jgi:hypothetical protein
MLNLLGSTLTDENRFKYLREVGICTGELEMIEKLLKDSKETSKRIDQISSEFLEGKINELVSIIEKLKNDSSQIETEVTNSINNGMIEVGISDVTVEKHKVKLAEAATKIIAAIARQSVWALNLLTSLKAVKESNDEIDRKALERRNLAGAEA